MDGVPTLIRHGHVQVKALYQMGKLFTNEKENKRAIKAAVDQYEIHRRNNTLAKHKRSRKNRAQNKRAKLRGNS